MTDVQHPHVGSDAYTWLFTANSPLREYRDSRTRLVALSFTPTQEKKSQ